jgi:hypothetical protein
VLLVGHGQPFELERAAFLRVAATSAATHRVGATKR